VPRPARGRGLAGDPLVLLRRRPTQPQHAGRAAAAHHPDHHPDLAPIGVLRRRRGQVLHLRQGGLSRRGEHQHLVREHHPEHLLAEHHGAELGVQGASVSGSCATGVREDGSPATRPIVWASCGSARSSSSVGTSANSCGGWSQPASATCPSTSPTTDCSGLVSGSGGSVMRPSSRTAAGTGRDPRAPLGCDRRNPDGCGRVEEYNCPRTCSRSCC
jgi:hypothetical protein